MIGAMKRKASLSLSESCSSQSPQSLNCHDNYLTGGGCLDEKKSFISSLGGTGCPEEKKLFMSSLGPGSLDDKKPFMSSLGGTGCLDDKKPFMSSLGGGGGNCPGGTPSTHSAPKPEKRIRWDGPRTQSLIDHYRTHEYLWNPKLADYKNDKKRSQCLEAWLELNHLEKELVNEVKMKLHGLRTSFGHQLKLESSNMSDMEKDEAGGFQSKWQWYNQLAFLKETMVFRSSSNNNHDGHSPSDSPPPDHGSHHHNHHHPMGGHHDDSDAKMELNAPINMQIMSYSHHSQPHEMPDYLVPTHHHSAQPHNLTISAVPPAVPAQAHETHPSLMPHSRKDEDDPLSYHHARITVTPPMAHMNFSTSHSQPPSLAQQTEIARYQSTCCSYNERPKIAVGEKLGRLVEETFNNLHPEYQEMAKIEIQQVLGKYLQKPVP